MEQIMGKLNSHKERLLARKVELSARLEKVEDLLDDPKSQSFSEQATEREFDEVYEAQGLASEQELSAIEAALNRIDNGTYGKCLSCGEPISAERLTAVPFTTKCRNCMQ